MPFVLLLPAHYLPVKRKSRLIWTCRGRISDNQRQVIRRSCLHQASCHRHRRVEHGLHARWPGRYSLAWPKKSAAVLLHSIADERGAWTEPVIATFSGEFNDFDLTMSPDGNRLYFTSNRRRLRVVRRWSILTSGTWIVRIKAGVSRFISMRRSILTCVSCIHPSRGMVLSISLAQDRRDLAAAISTGPHTETVNLGSPKTWSECQYRSRGGRRSISPDGDYLIFTSTRETGFGSGDLYVTFKLDDDRWSPPANLGEAVNTEYLEFCQPFPVMASTCFLPATGPRTYRSQKPPRLEKNSGSSRAVNTRIPIFTGLMRPSLSSSDHCLKNNRGADRVCKVNVRWIRTCGRILAIWCSTSLYSRLIAAAFYLIVLASEHTYAQETVD